MYGSEYLNYKNRVYAHASGYLTVSDVQKYVLEIESLIQEHVKEGWTFLADLRGMEQLSDDCYKELNRLRIVMLTSKNKISKSAVIVDSLVNQVKSVKSMHELDETFQEEYFTDVNNAELFLSSE